MKASDLIFDLQNQMKLYGDCELSIASKNIKGKYPRCETIITFIPSDEWVIEVANKMGITLAQEKEITISEKQFDMAFVKVYNELDKTVDKLTILAGDIPTNLKKEIGF